MQVPHASAQTSSEPTIVGWGGSRLIENQNYTSSPAVPSIVFPGESASDQEIVARTIVEKGFNAMRVSFAPPCTDPNGFMKPYSPGGLERAIRIAKTLGIWIIVDYHGYNDAFSDPTCWLNFWSGVTGQFRNDYSRIVWEPLNEPSFGPWIPSVCTDEVACLGYLSSHYQKLINQTRGQGDSHWIVVQNVCSFGCNYADPSDGYPSIEDPLQRVFISIHPYMSYKVYHDRWDNSTAEGLAREFYSAMVNGTRRTGLPILNTEGGPGVTYMEENGTRVNCPDLMVQGSSGYCRVNLHFIQTLTSLLESNPSGMFNWVWWPVGDWASFLADVLGALAPGGWGWKIPWPNLPTHRLSLESGGGGSIFPLSGNYSFVSGTTANVSAFPDSGMVLGAWELTSGQVRRSNPLQLELNTDQVVIAYFRPIMQKILVDSINVSDRTPTLGSDLHIDVAVRNVGDFPATLNVTASANRTIIGSRTVVGLPANHTQTVGFVWSTRTAQPGTYFITVIAGPVLGSPSSGNDVSFVTVEIGPRANGLGQLEAILSLILSHLVYLGAMILPVLVAGVSFILRHRLRKLFRCLSRINGHGCWTIFCSEVLKSNHSKTSLRS